MFIVITPARNEADQVEELVNCMRNSTYRPDCWLVVDDCSSDGTGDLFHKFGADLNYLKIHRIENRAGYMGFHYSEVVRLGLDEISDLVESADYIGILDADIRFGRNFWKRLKDAQNAENIGITGAIAVVAKGDDYLMEHFQRIDLPLAGRVLVRGKCFREIDGVPYSRSPDAAMCVLAKIEGWKTVLLEDVYAETTRPTDYKSEYDAVGKSRGQRAWNMHQPLWQVLIRTVAYTFTEGVGYAVNYFKGYVEEWKNGGEQFPDERVRHYYRNERTKEWLRSFFARLGGRTDPHKILKTSIVNRKDVFD